jgi:hypothetical protein
MLMAGPALTIDIAERLGRDTGQTSAILDYFVKREELGRTERGYGLSYFYFLLQDKDKAISRLYETLNQQEKSLVNKIRDAQVADSEDLSPAERYLSQNLTDFIKKVSAMDRETKKGVEYYYYYKLSTDDVRSIINGEKAKTRQQGIRNLQETSRLPAAKKLALRMLEPEIDLSKYGFSEPSRISKNVYMCNYGEHTLRVTVMVINKKSINKNDLIKAEGYASSNKTAVFILTTATKIAEKRQYGNLVNIIKVSQ